MNIILVGNEPPFSPPSRLRLLPRPGDPRPVLQHAQRERAPGELLAHALAKGALSQVPSNIYLFIYFVCEIKAIVDYSDNEFEYLSPEIRNLSNLVILAVRDNELVEVPQEIGQLINLRELHLQVKERD